MQVEEILFTQRFFYDQLFSKFCISYNEQSKYKTIQKNHHQPILLIILKTMNESNIKKIHTSTKTYNNTNHNYLQRPTLFHNNLPIQQQLQLNLHQNYPKYSLLIKIKISNKQQYQYQQLTKKTINSSIYSQHQKIKMKSSLNQYNQRLNRIFFNPYSRDPITSNSLDASISQVHSTPHITDQNYYQQNQQNGKGRNKNRLTASEMFIREFQQFGSNHVVNVKVEVEEKPVANFFVCEFQRLQAQNKRLLAKISEIQKTQPQNNTQQHTNNISSLEKQNEKLRKQLQQQKHHNRQKNQKISLLLNKISQIQQEVQSIAYKKKNKDQNDRINNNKQRQDKQRKQKQQQYEIMRQKENMVRLEMQNNMRVLRENMENEKVMEIRRIQKECQQKIEDIIRRYQEQRQISNAQRLQEWRVAYEDMQAFKSYYQQLIQKKSLNLDSKIQFLQSQLKVQNKQFLQLQNKVEAPAFGIPQPK